MKKVPSILFAALITLFSVSCGTGSSDTTSSDSTASADSSGMMVEEVDETVIVPTLSEDAIGPASLKHDPKKAKKKAATKPKDTTAAAAPAAPDTMPAYPQVAVVIAAFVDSGYTVSEPAPQPDTAILTASATPLSNTLTVYSVSKHNVKAFEIVSDPSNPDDVQQIIIDNKKKADVYNITPGMKTKELKKLDRKMKHIIKHGKVLYYSDDSNIMYTADLKDGQGNEISEADLDDLDISGVIWESKHKRKKLL